eukprot:IDg16354t1
MCRTSAVFRAVCFVSELLLRSRARAHAPRCRHCCCRERLRAPGSRTAYGTALMRSVVRGRLLRNYYHEHRKRRARGRAAAERGALVRLLAHIGGRQQGQTGKGRRNSRCEDGKAINLRGADCKYWNAVAIRMFSHDGGEASPTWVPKTIIGSRDALPYFQHICPALGPSQKLLRFHFPCHCLSLDWLRWQAGLVKVEGDDYGNYIMGKFDGRETSWLALSASGAIDSTHRP